MDAKHVVEHRKLRARRMRADRGERAGTRFSALGTTFAVIGQLVVIFDWKLEERVVARRLPQARA
jgi:hypothetical protein